MHATLYAVHIERAEKKYLIRLDRRVYFNVFPHQIEALGSKINILTPRVA